MTELDSWYLQPWRPLLDRAVLAARMSHVPTPLNDLHALPPQQAYEVLDDAMGNVFYACEQSVDLGEVLVARAVRHLAKRYAGGEQSYLRTISSRVINQDSDFIPPIPITGPAGSGKSSIAKAVRRALRLCGPVTIDGIEIQPVPLHIVPVGIAKSQLAVVRRVGGLGMNLEECCASAQRILYRDATAILIFGEMQFVNLSATANTLVAGILLQAGYFGVPSAYDANYSLMWRLRNRPQEERDRLLLNPIVIFPDVPGSQEAIEVSRAMLAVAPGVFAIDLKTDGAELDFRSGGLRRMKRRLLTLAYLMNRYEARGSDVSVTIDDIIKAYNSNKFKDSRLIIEEMDRRQSGVREKRIDDLSCPFDEPQSASQARDKANKEFRDAQLAETEFKSALSAEEKRALAQMGEGSILNRSSQKQKQKSDVKEPAKFSDRAANSAALAAELS